MIVGLAMQRARLKVSELIWLTIKGKKSGGDPRVNGSNLAIYRRQENKIILTRSNDKATA